MGHLLLAQEARWQLELDQVLLMVTGRAPHKEIADDPGAELRLEMTRLAAQDEQGVEASALEVEREGPSYSYLTLEQLAGEDGGRELFLLLGADMAATIERWKEPRRLLELSRLGVVPRPGIELDEVRSALDRLDAADRAEILEMPPCGASSTTVRQRVREGRPLRHLVPDPVVGLIEERGLYR